MTGLATTLLLAPLLGAEPSLRMAPPIDWQQRADHRIERIRKGDLRVVVTDPGGRPVAGASVRVEQLRHAFAFGSAINTHALTTPLYADLFPRLFEWAVMENEAKWYANERVHGFEDYADADALAAWCRERGILLRGHGVFWAKEQYTPRWVPPLSPPQLRAAIDRRLESAIGHFRGTFPQWDVNNEMLDGTFFRSRLGPDVEAYMYRRVKELDPQVATFVNDYGIFVASPDRAAAYIRQVRDLEARGARVDGIGIQGHFDAAVSPGVILARLDQLAVLGKPIWITEFDAPDPDPVRRADKLETLYRAAFSHPAVKGILMWGFWAGSHWRGPDAAIVDLDGTVNAAGRRYQALMRGWTTRGGGTTAADGTWGTRGFHGTYRVTVAAGTASWSGTVELRPGDRLTTLTVPLGAGAGTE